MPFYTHSFRAFALYNEPHESMKGFLRKRWSFWLALFSCIAFLVGNMVGQHGWQAFWKSVWGKDAEIQIVFTGTVPPLQRVPDPNRWSPVTNHNYDFVDVPKELLISLPSYAPTRGCDEHDEHDRRVLSVDYNGDYDSGAVGCGSHPAADILVPKGTPVNAVMNGVVDRAEERSWGFGNTVVLKHPNVPDPSQPEKKTTLYSNYAHLGNILVEQGQIVEKGQQIALSGQTGLATAPHLHFQIDREAPFHPYWPFTTTEATEAGYSFMEAVNAGLGKERAEEYTVNPLAYVEEFRGTSESMAVAKNDDAVPVVKTAKKSGIRERVIASIREFFASRRAARRAERIAKRNESVPAKSAIVFRGETSIEQIEESVEQIKEERADGILIESSKEAVNVLLTAETDIPEPKISGTVFSITVLHDGEYGNTWEQIVLFARDAEGRFVQYVRFEGEIMIGTAFGDAEFSPSMLTEEQFDNRGRAIVQMLPRNGGRRAIVPVISGVFTARGEPFAFNPAEEILDEKIASGTVSLQQEGASQ